MNIKMKARIAGLIESAQWTKEMESYRAILERISKLPLPDKMILQYVKGLDNKDKLKMALALEFSFAKRELRKWPEMLFVKMLRTSILQAQKEIVVKRQLLLSILHTIPSLSSDEEEELATLLDEKDQYIAEHGFWTFYWTVYFHPDMENNNELWTKETALLSERTFTPHDEVTPKLDSANTNATPTTTAIDAEQNKYEKKITLLEGLYAKETTQRQQLEQELVLKNKQLRIKSEEHQRLNIAFERQKREIELNEAKKMKLNQLQQEREHRWKLEQDAWLSERQVHMNTIRSLNSKQNQLEQTIESHTKELYVQNKDKAQLRQTISTIKDTLNDQGELIQRLKLSLYQEIEELASSQLHVNDSRFGEARSRIRKALDLADALEIYQAAVNQDQQTPHRETTPIHGKELSANIPNETGFSHPSTHSALVPNRNAAPSLLPEEEVTSFHGTFYRRDHGGYIKLENDATFNITESIVYQHGLQHEAEVLCTPSKPAGTGTGIPSYYNIQLLFQGDDTYSPVHQFDGYILLDEDKSWYCVDMNQSENRFHIHHKDLEIQKPAHGDPCTFNVYEGGHIARITKLYRLNAGFIGADKSAHPADFEQSRQKQSREKRNSTLPKSTASPFLRGCTIMIVGGLRKWFEEVVLECGAELVHENGDHPERISSDLKRSQALFLLITSTSHRATWNGIEIAKAHGIPHFIIQGSKSNLRMLLWDNRGLINRGNQLQ